MTAAVHHRAGAKFTEAQVLDIRARCVTEADVRQIASEYTVRLLTVRRIVRGETWKHLLPKAGA